MATEELKCGRDYCRVCRSKNLAIGLYFTESGVRRYPYYCLDCDKNQWYYAKYDFVHKLELKGVEIRRRYSYSEKMETKKLCEVCSDDSGTETHHFAPRHLFGDEAELWKTAELCKTCHKRWHDLVTPNMCRKNDR